MASLDEWAAAADNDDEDNGAQEFMVSSLPLVFCNGRPMALDNIPERNLVTFVRFMLKCALGVDETQLKLVRRPAWWPRTIPYFNFRANKEVHKGHAERLRELVRCCFRGHRCEMLLKFCGDLERQCASGSMLFKNNFDGTSSLYERRTNRLVVTCRNENLEYDGAAAGALSPRRLLLPRLARGPGAQLAMVQPPPTDIYLCDSCSAEFTSIDQVKAHERKCGASPHDGPASDAESTCSEPEVQCHDQTRFLSYVGLAPADGTGRQPYASPAKQRTHPSKLRRKRSFGALSRYQPVDVSSPLGLRLSTGGASADLDTACEEAERYCDNADRKRVARQPTFPVVWRPHRVRGRVVHAWSHLFSFTAAQRAERRRTIRTGG